MAITETNPIPYELMGRWNKDGSFSGAHIGFRTLVLRDGVEIADMIHPVQPVAIGARSGFPLADILSQLQIDALVRCDVLQAQVAARDAQIATMQATIDAQVVQIGDLQPKSEVV